MQELTALSEAQRQQAMARFRLLQPHLEAGRSLVQAAGEAGIPYRTAQRWVALYRQFGLAGLVRKARADRNESRALSPEMEQMVEGLALQQPPLPVATLYRQV